MLGYSGVGKTALGLRLSGADFRETSATHGANTWSLGRASEKEVTTPAGLLDLGGMPHEDLVSEIQKADFSVAIVVVDPGRNSVKKDVAYWCELLESRNDDPPCEKFLVVSRVDMGGDTLGAPDLEELSKEHGFSGAFRTSAKDDSGIQELRSAVINASREQEEETDEPETTVQILVRTLAEKLCQLIAVNPHALQEIEWRDLERVIAEALEGIGFEVELTPPAKDGGKDIILNCRVGKEEQTFYVEIKHWRQGGRPGLGHVSDFVEVNAVDCTHGGLFLSSSGFTNMVYGRLGEISKQRIRLGERNKIVSLCQNYVKSIDGFWQPEVPLPEILFEETLG
jgi:GTPase SAR1 family protein